MNRIMKHQPFSLMKRLKSFCYAFNGLRILFKEEHNSRIHLAAAIVVIIAAIYLDLNPYELIAIIFSIGLVIITEIINTAIESIADFISPGQDERIRKIKDLAAAAVLVSVITAVTIGVMVFISKIRLCF